MYCEVGTYSRDFEALAKRVEQLGKLVHDDGGRCTISGMCYQDFIGILLNSGYTVTIKPLGDGTYTIEYYREEDA